MHKPVILIGGTAGAGKTTLARRLCQALDIDHRMSTGFIREILRDGMDEATSPAFFVHTFQASDPVAALVEQAQRLQRPVSVCIGRARREGTSLIMEGNHLIPKLYHHIQCDLFLMLGAPDIDEHRRRLLGQTHAKRPLSETDLARARVIDEYLRCEAAHYAIPCMRYDGEVDSIVQALLG